jgi:hypothetical protein
VDLIEFMAEELADLANYARFLFIKIKAMEAIASESGINLADGTTGKVQQPDELSTGPSAFVAKSEVSGFLPKDGKER